MSIRPFRDIKRRKTKKIKVGNVEIGGNAPISVQSMTNTLTTNVDAIVKQISELTEAGADIVRVSCPDKDSTLSLKKIIKLSLIHTDAADEEDSVDIGGRRIIKKKRKSKNE